MRDKYVFIRGYKRSTGSTRDRSSLQVTYTVLILDSGFRRNDGKEQQPALTVTPDPIRGPAFFKVT